MTLMFITCKSITYFQNKLHGVKVKCLLNVWSFPPHFVGQSFRFLSFFLLFSYAPITITVAFESKPIFSNFEYFRVRCR